MVGKVNAAKHEITNWLQRSGWTAHFMGQDLSEIHASSRMPGPGEEEARQLIAATNRLFFNRCVAGLRSMPLMTRLLLASPHPKDAHSRPFGPLQEKTSIDRYATLLERHGFQFTPGQRVGLEALWEHLQNKDCAEKDLEEEVLQHFIAMLRINGESGQLRPAHLFTYVLAGLIYVGRALLSEFAIPARERGTIKDLKGRFAAVRDEWLCKATYSPMGYTLSLLLYGKKIARETGSRLMVSWNRQCDLIYFIGKPIAIDAIQSMVAEMITDAKDILWGELMFKEGHDVRFTIPLNTIKNDLTYTHRGKSFIHTNNLEGKEVEMLEDLGIRKYQKSVQKFKELLVLAVQQTWGSGIARGNEIGSLRLVNGVNHDQSIFVINSDVVLITQYHKSLAHFDSPKVIPRIVPPRVGQLLAMYMVYHDENGPWEGAKISKAMAKWTHYYMGKHTRGKQADTEGDSDDDLGLDLDEAEQYKVPNNLAAAHSTATAANYGVTADILKRLTADSLEVFSRVSRRWHRFLNLDRAPCTALTASRKRRASTAAKPEETLVRTPAKRPKPLLLRRPGEYKGDMILAAARETPLVAVLPTGSGKSLVFMVPAILARAGVTIVVAPFAELKRQLVSRCADAGLECKQWPEAQDVWPRVTVILAEAACHLTFTAADEYRGKLRDLVLLRGLGCLFVFLTGTLPLLRQRDHRLNMQYSVVRVKNSRGIAKVKKLVLSRRQDLAKSEKGVVYCASYAKCKVLAQQLGCHYYHGLPSDSNAHFFAQRKERFQAWLEGTTPYIVATAALGMGIDVPGIKHVIHLEAPYSIIDYAQEAGHWPSEDASKDGYLEVKVREVNSLVRTRGCRRRLLRQYLDSDLRDCKALEAVMCDNCEQESRLESALEEIEELGKPSCRVCWMFKGAMGARHRWYDCAKVDESLSFRHYIICFYCYVSQSLCTKGFKSKGASCRWKHVVMPVALAAATKESLWEQVQQLAGREFKGEEDFCGWLRRKHAKLVCGEEITNAMAVFNLVVEWRAGQGLGQGLTASCGHGL
ncbi:hypothetical protein CC79DRAFT_1347853 [Sarocladium strictum]